MCCRHSEVRSFYPLTLVALLRRYKGARRCCRSQRAGGFIQQQRASTLTGLFFKLAGRAGSPGRVQEFKDNFLKFTLKMKRKKIIIIIIRPVGLLAFTRCRVRYCSTWASFTRIGVLQSQKLHCFKNTHRSRYVLKAPFPVYSTLFEEADVIAVNPAPALQP